MSACWNYCRENGKLPYIAAPGTPEAIFAVVCREIEPGEEGSMALSSALL
jgi:hypothetical protein